MITNRVGLIGLIAILGSSLAAGADKAAQPRSIKTGQVDYLKELVDDYYEGSERMRFFAAAGVDIELSKTEFAAAKGKAGSFIRGYDRWQAAVAFDKDSNGTLDWFEAEAYRLSLQARVMSMFDRNKDRTLKGPERDAANRWLARGVKPIARRPAPATVRVVPIQPRTDEGGKGPAVKGGTQELTPGAAWQQTWREMEREFDKDGDGALSNKERKELYKAYRQRFRQRMLEQWDFDRDGQLSKQERDHMAAELRKVAQQRQEAFAKRRKEPISPTELARRKRAAMHREANRRIFAEARQQAAAEHEAHMRRWDTDGDGKLSDAERSLITLSREQAARQQRVVEDFDKDKDGRLSESERAAIAAQQVKDEVKMAAYQERREQQRKDRLSKWDTDGDGKLSVQEQRALYEEVMRIEAKLRRGESDGKDTPQGDAEAEKGRAAESKKAPALAVMTPSTPQNAPELPQAAEERHETPPQRHDTPRPAPRAGSQRRQSIAASVGGGEGSAPHLVAAIAAGIGASAALVATVLLFARQHHFRSALSRLMSRIFGRGQGGPSRK